MNNLKIKTYKLLKFVSYFFLWSESHTSYELRSLSENIIYEISLNFNESMENFVIL